MTNRLFHFSTAVLAILLVAASTVSAAPAMAADSADPTIVFLVRHAEKAHDSDHDNARGPGLTGAGLRRAETLARILGPAGITRIHSTDYRRTLETARPLAVAEGLEVETYDPRDPGALVSHLRESLGRHLVVGHSNTTPDLVERLGGEPGSPIDEATEYDRLYVLVLEPNGAAVTIRQRYGAPPSP